MKKTLVYLLASLVLLMMSGQAYAEIEWSGNIMAGVEKMKYGTPPETIMDYDEEEEEVDFVWSEKSEKLQFSNIKVNLDVKAEVCEGVTGVAQLRGVCDDPNITKRCVYIELGNPIIPATLQIGRIELPLGLELSTKLSDGANTMRNPLIFNSLLTEDVEKAAIDDGLLIAKKCGAVECKLGITNGDSGDWEEKSLQPICKDTNSKKAITLNLSGEVSQGLTLGGTYYTNDAVDEPNIVVVNEPDVKLKVKAKITGWIVDVGFQKDLLKLAAAIGNIENKITGTFITGATTETETEKMDTDYLVGEVVYGNGETPWWVAARYSTKKPTTKLSLDPSFPDPKDDVKKLELGVGYKLCENTYLKVEYVDVELKDDVKDLEDYKGIKAIVNVAF